MNAAGHRLAGYISGISTGLILHLPIWQSLTMGVIAGCTSGGKLSPDIDQTSFYRLLLPKKLEGHRKLTHWWVVLAIITLICVILYVIEYIFIAFILISMIIGWWSHLLIDFIFGAPGGGRDAGIPTVNLNKHRGILGKHRGLKSNGIVAKFTSTLILPTLCIIVTLYLFIQ